MERVHQLVAVDNLDAEDDDFWINHWPHIASAKVPLATKIAAYHALNDRGAAYVNNLYTTEVYEMVLADRHFVDALDLNANMQHCYQLCVIWIEDDVSAFARYSQDMTDEEKRYALALARSLILIEIKAPRCIRFLLQDKPFREMMTQWRMSPLVQRFIEELVQPTDNLYQWPIVSYGQSVKLVGMFVKDEELVAGWLKRIPIYQHRWCAWMSVMFARKLHALATPEQRSEIKTEVLQTTPETKTGDGYFEMAWLCGLLGPRYPKIQTFFREDNVSLFPALTFAMIVAKCDGYLVFARSRITGVQRRFVALMTRLPMDLQALVSLQLWDRTSAVIRSDEFDRALLAVI